MKKFLVSATLVLTLGSQAQATAVYRRPDLANQQARERSYLDEDIADCLAGPRNGRASCLRQAAEGFHKAMDTIAAQYWGWK